MSKQYLESVPANEVPATFGEVPKDWIYYSPFECWLRPVSLPVQDVKYQALLEACKEVVKGYEGDGMENMRARDEVFYRECKAAIELTPTPTVTTQGEGEFDAEQSLKDAIHDYLVPGLKQSGYSTGSEYDCDKLDAEIDRRTQLAIEILQSGQPASLPAAGGPTKPEIIELLDALRDIDLESDFIDPPSTVKRCGAIAGKAIKTFFDKYQNYTL